MRREALHKLAEVGAVFGKLGCICFGGPVAHIGYFRAEFVERRRWLRDTDFADLVALCQFLPGPGSSQFVFAVGLRRAGLPGAVLASLGFMLPSVLLMMAFASGIAAAGDLGQAGWVHGLKLAAVAVVAQAVWGMGRSLCPDRARLSLCLAAAAWLIVQPGALTQVAALAVGAAVGTLLYRRTATPGMPDETEPAPGSRRVAAVVLVVFLALLFLLPAVTAYTRNMSLAVFDSFYRAGSLVFGGGHVVLPLLRAELVPTGWVSDDRFLAGYGAAQAVPGPLFTFAGYLGVVMQPPGWTGWVNGAWCLLAVFLPGWLLIGGALPFWHRMRGTPVAQAALRGANAAVVGVLLAALYRPVVTESIRDGLDVTCVLLAFLALHVWKAPPWAVVLAMALAGHALGG